MHEPAREAEVLGGEDDGVEVGVAEDEPPAALEDAGRLEKEGVGVGQDLQDVEAHRPVEGAVPEGQGLGEVGDHHPQARVACEGRQRLLGPRVDPHERAPRAHAGGDLHQRVAATAAEVDHPAVGTGVQQLCESSVALRAEHGT